MPMHLTTLHVRHVWDTLTHGHCHAGFSPLYNQGYIPILSPGEPTNISAANLKGSHSYDNVWVDRKVHSERYDGQYKIVRRGLQHQLIEGKKPGTPGTVSDHCPIWVCFSTK